MTPRKQKALQALITSRTQTEAAAVAGVGISTLRGYLKDPEFAAAYKREAAGIMDTATRRLQMNLTAAVDRLGKIVANDEETSANHITAARTLLDYGLRFTEFNDVLTSLEETDHDVL